MARERQEKVVAAGRRRAPRRLPRYRLAIASIRFRIQVAGQRVWVPPEAKINIEHERSSSAEEIEFQLKWQLEDKFYRLKPSVGWELFASPNQRLRLTRAPSAARPQIVAEPPCAVSRSRPGMRSEPRS